MVFSLDHISGSPSTSMTSTLAPSLTSSALELRLVGHCPVGGSMRHQQLVARNLRICVEKGTLPWWGSRRCCRWCRTGCQADTPSRRPDPRKKSYSRH